MTQSISKLCQATIDYDVMRRHVDLSQRSLKAELDDLEATMNKDLKGTDEDEQDAYFSNINDYWIETTETLPLLQWYSQLMIVFAYFEKSLNDLCCNLRTERKFALALKDLHGQGITRAKDYLTKVASIRDIFENSDWQQIQIFAELRNSIAHGYGFVAYEPQNPKSSYCRLSRMDGLELRQDIMNQPDAQILIGPHQVLMGLNLVDSFTRKLISALRDGYRSDAQLDTLLNREGVESLD